MDFLTEEVIKETGITPEQAVALKAKGDAYIADQKKAWDDKANNDAQSILNGALEKTVKDTGIPRNTGEKAGDYIKRAAAEHLTNIRKEVEDAKAEYEKKVKEFKGDETTKAELEKYKKDFDDAQKKLADFDTLKEKAEKLEPLETEYKNMKEQVAFTGVKPAFPDTANAYEVKAKWEDFIKGVKEKYTIELKDGEAVAIDKENHHKVTKLRDLVAADETLKALQAGRAQGGTGAKQIPVQKVEGVPFDIPAGATSKEIQTLIRSYLTETEKLDFTGKEYAKRFTELRDKISKK